MQKSRRAQQGQQRQGVKNSGSKLMRGSGRVQAAGLSEKRIAASRWPERQPLREARGLRHLSRRMIDLALVHHPVVDKRGDLVTTSVTNIDLHDIARSCRVFGVRTYWVVTPVDSMHWLVERITRHWREGWGKGYNPKRGEALKGIRLARSMEEVIASYEENERPNIVATSARDQDLLSIREMSDIARDERLLLVFGTGNGLAPAALEQCDAILPPIRGLDEYNHLSVRSAVAIYLHELARERGAFNE
jgi:hypothetical protein